MTPPASPVNSVSMIMIASEQVWPNLHALLHWARKGNGVESIHILHTRNEKASALPARRMHALLSPRRGERGSSPFRFRTLAEPVELGTQPQEVAESVERILCGEPDSEWIIVANGGLKTMTLGLLHAMANPRISVVYSELGGQWQRVLLDQGRVVTRALPEVSETDMDRLPLDSLVEAQHVCDQEGVHLSVSEIEPLDVVRFARACMTNDGWDWCAGGRQLGMTQVTSGPLFEKWCGALLLHFGVSNLVAGLRVSTTSGNTVSENDLLCIYKGRFYYIELKLVDEETDRRPSFVESARKASLNCSTLGGASGTPLLLLPNRRLSQSDSDVLPLFRPSPKVLGASDSFRLISWLATQLRVDSIPNELLALEAEILEWARRGGFTRAFGREFKGIRQSGGDPAVCSLDAVIDSIRRERRQNWMLAVLQGRFLIRMDAAEGKSPPPGWVSSENCWQRECTTKGESISIFRKHFGPFVNGCPSISEIDDAWNRALEEIRSIERSRQHNRDGQFTGRARSATQKRPRETQGPDSLGLTWMD